MRDEDLPEQCTGQHGQAEDQTFDGEEDDEERRRIEQAILLHEEAVAFIAFGDACMATDKS